MDDRQRFRRHAPRAAGHRHGRLQAPVDPDRLAHPAPDCLRRRADGGTILEDVAALERLTPELLAAHEILCLVHTSGDLPLSDAQKQAILDFVAGGNGFVGVHGATHHLLRLVGVPRDAGRALPAASPRRRLHGHRRGWRTTRPPATYPPPSRSRTSCTRSARNPRDLARVLLSAAPGSLDLEGDLPLAWIKSYGAGRVYYNGLGHFDATWDDPQLPGADRRRPALGGRPRPPESLRAA